MKYRPCIVTEHIHNLVPSQGTEYMLDIHEKTIGHTALFHTWSYTFLVRDPVVFRRFGGQTSTLVGIVEYEDGTIHEHSPQDIRFTDGMAMKKLQKHKWNKLTEDTYSYPEAYKNVLFKTSDGRVYYGCCDTECEWEIELENESIFRIKDVIAWKEL